MDEAPMERPQGTLTKIISVSPFAAPTQPDELEIIAAEELGEPVPEELEGETTTLVDELLLGYERGFLPNADLPPMQASANPLIVDIDDGRPDPPQHRLGQLKRVDTSTRKVSKFNRFTGVWE